MVGCLNLIILYLTQNCMKFVKELKSSASTQSSIDKANSWQGSIYNLMGFSRELAHEFTPDYINSLPISCILHESTISQFIDANFLNMLAAVSSEAGIDKVIQAKIHHIILISAMHYACTSLLMDKTVFMLLDEIFSHFVTLWMEMKSQGKVKEDGESEYFKLKPRSIVLEDIVDANYISDTDESLAFGSEELLMEHEFTSMKHPAKEDNDMEEEWSMIPECVLKSLVNIHSLLFGSNKLVEQTPPSFKLTEDRLSSFMDSYALGAK